MFDYNAPGPAGRVPRLAGPGAVLALVLLVTATSGTAAAASATSASSVPTQATPVTLTSDGWFHYYDPLVAKLTLGSPTDVTVQGTPTTDGGCAFKTSSTGMPGGPATFSSEIALNPATCQETVLEGTINATGEADVQRAFGQEVTAAPVATSNAAAQVTNAASVTYSSANSDSGYFDPPGIQITGMTTDLTWPLHGAAGTPSGQRYPYEFGLDGWTTNSPSVFVYNEGYGNYGSEGEADFYNSDFEEAMLGAFPFLAPVIYAACGFSFSQAHFHNDTLIDGNSDGSHAAFSYDSASGGCSDLVHDDSWSGSGWAT